MDSFAVFLAIQEIEREKLAREEVSIVREVVRLGLGNYSLGWRVELLEAAVKVVKEQRDSAPSAGRQTVAWAIIMSTLPGAPLSTNTGW